jgi:polyisoprenoid-binding protein YceI
VSSSAMSYVCGRKSKLDIKGSFEDGVSCPPSIAAPGCEPLRPHSLTGAWRARFGLGASLCCLVAAGAGCDQKAPRQNAAPAPAPPPSVAARAAPAVPPQSPVRYLFPASSSGSKVEFIAALPTGEIKGSFSKFSGTIVAVGIDPSRASVTAQIDMTSVQTADPALTARLKSPALFDVARYPQARFVSTAMQTGGDLGATNTMTGTLEWRGITKVVSVPMTLHLRSSGVAVDAELSINRKDFGIVSPGRRGALVADKVRVLLDIYAEPVNPVPSPLP